MWEMPIQMLDIVKLIMPALTVQLRDNSPIQLQRAF